MCSTLCLLSSYTGTYSEQISTIKTEISNKTHLLIWNNKVKRDELGKQLLSLKKEGAKLEEPTVASMSLS